jgi:hypothetical protein
MRWVIILMLLGGATPAFAGWNGTCPVEGPEAYKLQPASKGTGYIRVADGHWFAEGFARDWACFTLWKAAGNTPLPAD